MSWAREVDGRERERVCKFAMRFVSWPVKRSLSGVITRSREV